MTQRTKTDLINNVINSLLPDNVSGEISPEDLRTGFVDTTDSVIFWDASAPSSASATCSAGQINFAATEGVYFLYICVATDTWKRAELASF